MKIKDACSLEERLWPTLQHIKKQRHYFANKGPSSQSYGFSSSHIWKWELDYKESGAQKNWCLWTVVLDKTLECSVDCKEVQPVHSPEFSLEGLMLKLKLQSFGHLMWRTDSSEKTLILGKTEGRRREWQRMRWLDGINDYLSLSKLWGWWWTQEPGVLQSKGLQRVRHSWGTELKFRGRQLDKLHLRIKGK